MTPPHPILALLCAFASLAAASASAEPPLAGEPELGRLFLSPEGRAMLERQRQLNIQMTRALEGETLRLDGVVVRSSGKSTVWINGQPQTESRREMGVTTRLSRQDPGHAILSSGDKQTVDLKVGVTLDQASGEKRGDLAAGEIRIHRRGAPR